MTIEEAWKIIKNMVNLEYTASTYDKALVVIEQALHELRRLQGKQKPNCDRAEWGGDKCLGFGHSENDDEPIDVCKKCEKYVGWGVE